MLKNAPSSPCGKKPKEVSNETTWKISWEETMEHPPSHTLPRNSKARAKFGAM